LIAWESLYNPDFQNPNRARISKEVQMDPFRIELMRNGAILTLKKWIETTNALGIMTKSGRYGFFYLDKKNP